MFSFEFDGSLFTGLRFFRLGFKAASIDGVRLLVSLLTSGPVRRVVFHTFSPDNFLCNSCNCERRSVFNGIEQDVEEYP